MPHSRVAGFNLPCGFDVASYDSVNDHAAVIANPNDPTAPSKKNSWFCYASAWKGLAIRLRSADEYNHQFADWIARGTAPEQEVRYAQERALFGCLTSALSAVECFFMAAYGIASVIAPNHFTLKEPNNLNKKPQDVANSYSEWLPDDPFSKLLCEVAKSTELRELADLRNALAHRGVLPQQHFLSTVADTPSTIPSNPKSLPVDFDNSTSLSYETTAIRVSWVCKTTSQLVAAFNVFLARDI